MTEWRPIKDWPRHEVSDDGQIRLTVRALRGRHAGIIRSYITSNGYPLVHFYKNGTRYTFLVHRLVCEAFNGPPPSDEFEVGHRDGSRTNNRADNLRWVTRKENCDDALIHGTRLRGEKQNGAKLTADDVIRIRALAAAGVKQDDIAAQFGVIQQNISRIVRRIQWRHIR